MSELSACPVCGYQVKSMLAFCQHCVVPLIYWGAMPIAERREYYLALYRWYIMHDEMVYESIEFERVMLGEVHDYNSRECYACKVGTLDFYRTCNNCGFIDIPSERISRLALPVLEAAVNKRRRWTIASNRPMVSYVEDYTNNEEVLKGLEERTRRVQAALDEWKRRALTQIESQKHLKEIEQARSTLKQAMEQGLEEAANYAQRHVEKAMYYGQEMVLPGSSLWSRLSTEQQKTMLARHKVFQEWWNRAVLIGILLYCAIAPFAGAAMALIFGVGAIIASTAIVVSWYNAAINLLLRRISTIAILAGMAFLVVASLSNGGDILLTLGGFILLASPGAILAALLRGLFWRIRGTWIK